MIEPTDVRSRIQELESEQVSLSQEFDAKVWAKEFVRIFTKTRLLRAGIDEQTMIGWFANASMAGYDNGSTKTGELEKELDRLKSELADHVKRVKELEEQNKA